VNLVSLSVTVTDARERHVPGLSRLDFAVFEDGKPQEITHFGGEPAALDLAILMDTSGSMQRSMPMVQDAAVRLIGSLRPGDRASFTEVKRGATTLQPLTGDFGGLEPAIRATAASGETAIYQAIYVALRDLRRIVTPGEVRRQALVVLSDGDDTASVLSFDDVLEAARRSGVAIYGVSLRPPYSAAVRDLQSPTRDRVDGDYALRTLADKTGGRSFFNLSPRDLSRVCRSIAKELSEQYSLGYVSADPREDGRFRTVAVRVVSLSNTRTRTRPGYFAAGRTLASLR
jgi:Ca-activated chloride channel family protein